MCEHHNKEYYSFRRICAEGDVFLLTFATFYKHMGAFSLVPNMCMNDCLSSLQHYTLLSKCTTQFYFKLLQKKKKSKKAKEANHNKSSLVPKDLTNRKMVNFNKKKKNSP